MSDEQQYEGGRKPQTSHASKSHAPKSSYVADSWRELAEDARQWADGRSEEHTSELQSQR